MSDSSSDLYDNLDAFDFAFRHAPTDDGRAHDTQERTMTKSTYPSRFATFPRSFVMGFLDANKAAPVRLNQPFCRDNSFFNGRTFSLGIRGGF
jgi:hypothetical protein